MSSVEIEKYTFETTHRITLKLRVFSTLCNFYTCVALSRPLNKNTSVVWMSPLCIGYACLKVASAKFGCIHTFSCPLNMVM